MSRRREGRIATLRPDGSGSLTLGPFTYVFTRAGLVPGTDPARLMPGVVVWFVDGSGTTRPTARDIEVKE